jgi:DNA-binding CsgD family transcriptional regulator
VALTIQALRGDFAANLQRTRAANANGWSGNRASIISLGAEEARSMISRPIQSKRFVGRRAELEALERRFDEASHGVGSTIVVCGDAGIGKTRLVNEFSRGLADRGRCVTGACLEYIQSPFAPYLEILRALHAATPDELNRDPFRRRILARLLPELGESQGRSEQVEEERRSQFEAIAKALVAFATRQHEPLVLVVEDLQWADTASLDLTQFLLGPVSRAPLLLLATCRDSDVQRDHPARVALSRFERSDRFWRLVLEPLSHSDVSAIIVHALGGTNELDSETIHAICKRAEGNPFFAQELAKSAVYQTEHLGKSNSLPATVAQAVAERAGRMTPQAQRVLSVAASLGRRFNITALAQLSDLTLEDTVPIVRQAIDRHLVVDAASRDADSYEFSHALIQEAVCAEMLASEARQLHARIGTMFEASPEKSTRIPELAYHWWRAQTYDKAAHYSEEAGDAASRLFAFADAAVFYERAIEAIKRLGGVRPDLFTTLGRALLFAGSSERARTAYQKALDLYEAQGSVQLIAQTCISYGRMCCNIGDDEGARQMLERVLALLEQSPRDPACFSALVLLSFLDLRHARARAALDRLNEAARFEGQRPMHDEMVFYNHRSIAHRMLGDANAAIMDLRRAQAIAREARDVTFQVRLLGNLALCLASFGQRDDAEANMREALQIAEERCIHGLFLACCLLQYANISLNFGDVRRTRDLVERVLASGVGDIEVQIDAASYGMTVALALEDDDLRDRCTRTDLLERAFAARERRQNASIARGFVELYVARGEIDKARELLHRVVETFGSLPDEFEEEILPYVAAYGADADIEPARGMLRRHVEAINDLDARGQSCLFEAYASRRAGDDDMAKRLGDEAAKLYHQMRRPNHEAKALEVAGHIDAALAIYRDLGNTGDARRLARLVSPPNRRGRTQGDLTRRELQVARLVADGKSNAAIAQALVISERTVEHHVASIFRRLDVSSRSELAARLTREAALRERGR